MPRYFHISLVVMIVSLSWCGEVVLAESPEEMVDRGDALFENRQVDRAIHEYDLAIAADPKFAPAYASRGGLLAAMGKYDKALADCTAAIKLNPQQYSAYVNRSNAYCELKRYQLAIDDGSSAIAVDPSRDEAFAARARAYDGSGQFERAIDDLNRAIRRFPSHSEYYDHRAALQAKLHRTDEAIISYSTALLQNKHDQNALFGRARLYVLQGQIVKALQDYADAFSSGFDPASLGMFGIVVLGACIGWVILASLIVASFIAGRSFLVKRTAPD